MPLRRVRAAATGLLLAAILGCGAESDPPALPADEAARLRSHLAAVRSAAAAGDRAKATRALEAFRTDVAGQEAAGNLPAVTYASLERAIARTRRRIGAEVVARAPAPAPPVAVAPPVAAAPAPQTPPQGKGKGKGNGARKGKGRGK